MDKKEIAQMKFNGTRPTRLNMKQLQDWVIWQFPKPYDKGYCGAVHPPLEKYGWLPAIVQPEKNEIYIHGNVPETFESPELAAEYLSANGKD